MGIFKIFRLKLHQDIQMNKRCGWTVDLLGYMIAESLSGQNRDRASVRDLFFPWSFRFELEQVLYNARPIQTWNSDSIIYHHRGKFLHAAEHWSCACLQIKTRVMHTCKNMNSAEGLDFCSDQASRLWSTPLSLRAVMAARKSSRSCLRKWGQE